MDYGLPRRATLHEPIVEEAEMKCQLSLGRCLLPAAWSTAHCQQGGHLTRDGARWRAGRHRALDSFDWGEKPRPNVTDVRLKGKVVTFLTAFLIGSDTKRTRCLTRCTSVCE